jgi:hypothetical protein
MDFYHEDFLFCLGIAIMAGIICWLIDNDNEDAESKGVGQGIITMIACAIIICGVLASVLKWLF